MQFFRHKKVAEVNRAFCALGSQKAVINGTMCTIGVLARADRQSKRRICKFTDNHKQKEVMRSQNRQREEESNRIFVDQIKCMHAYVVK